MQIEDFKKSKKELEKIKEQNNEKISMNERKFRLVNYNQLETKALITCFFSIISYMVFFGTALFLMKLSSINIIKNILKVFSYPGILLGCSLMIGIPATTLFYKKYNNKNKLKEFFKAKTQLQKLEEEIDYQIELEKANNRNKAIDESIILLDKNQSILNKMSNRYDLIDRNAPKNKDEANQKSEELSSMIEKQYDKLDLLVTKKVLHERFWRVRNKWTRSINSTFASIVVGIFIFAFSNFQSLLFASGSISSFASAIVPFIVGIIGSNIYITKRNENYKMAFNNFNNKLGENALVEDLYSAIDEKEEIESLIENQIKDISLSTVQLQETRRYLDSYLIGENKKSVTVNNNFCNVSEIEKKQAAENCTNNKAKVYTLAKRKNWLYVDKEKRTN